MSLPVDFNGQRVLRIFEHLAVLKSEAFQVLIYLRLSGRNPLLVLEEWQHEQNDPLYGQLLGLMRNGQGQKLLLQGQQVPKDALVVAVLVQLGYLILEVGIGWGLGIGCHAGVYIVAEEVHDLRDLLGLCLR